MSEQAATTESPATLDAFSTVTITYTVNERHSQTVTVGDVAQALGMSVDEAIATLSQSKPFAASAAGARALGYGEAADVNVVEVTARTMTTL